MIFTVDGLRVYFPFAHIYPEQYEYIKTLKASLDAAAAGSGANNAVLLEMPSGTGKTVSLLAACMSYQAAHEGVRVAYCTRTVAEVAKVLEEAKLVHAMLPRRAAHLTLGLSARRQLCANDAVRQKAATAASLDDACYDARADDACAYYSALAPDDSLRAGVYTLGELHAAAAARGRCPYYLARQLLPHAQLVVFAYQYVLDPAIAAAVTASLDRANTIVVFDEAHNIDGVCTDALSLHLTRPTLDAAARQVARLTAAVRRVKDEDRERLEREWREMVDEQRAATEEAAPRPAIPMPEALATQVMPGNLRRATHFAALLRRLVLFLLQRQAPPAVQSVRAFVAELAQHAAIDRAALAFVERRLASLLRTLELRELAAGYGAVQLVARLAALVARAAASPRPTAFTLLAEPAAPLQLVCLDPSLALAPVLAAYRAVVITSGTLSPLTMYPRMLAFQPNASRRLGMSLARPAICPLFVTRGADQVALSSKFDARDDVAVVRNYGALLAELAAVVPDGIVVFFPSYRYLESLLAAWHALGLLAHIVRHKLLFVETDTAAETTVALLNYRRACDVGRGAVLLAVARGKVSEGIDFAHHYARAVLLIGVPYLYTESRVLRARLEYLRDTYRVKEGEWLVFDALRQAAQCVGRVVRGKRDYGLVVFADRRFNRKDKIAKLPQWIQQHVQAGNMNLSTDMALEIAKHFLKEMAAPFSLADQMGVSLWDESHIPQ